MAEDLTTLRGQQARLKRLAQDQTILEALETQRVLGSLRQLAANADFQVVLDSWIARVVLVPLTNADEMAKHNFVVTLLDDLRRTTMGERL